jgi:hypothetical protein
MDASTLVAPYARLKTIGRLAEALEPAEFLKLPPGSGVIEAP